MLKGKINDLTLDKVLGVNQTSDFEVLEKEEILQSLLLQFPKVDFKELVYESDYLKTLKDAESLDPSIREKAQAKLSKFKLNQTHYYIHTVEEIIKVSTINDWDVVVNNEKVFIYNKAYWVNIDDKRFSNFLGEVSEKLGVPKNIARDYKFREKITKQFWLEEFIPNINNKDSNVFINLLNGTLKFNEGRFCLKEFDKANFLTYRLNYPFNRESEFPMFQEFLDKVVPDKSLQLILAEYIGYIFIPNNYQKFKAEKVLILYGTGANGKSVFNSIIKALIGEENITEYSLSSLTLEGNASYRAKIENKLLNYSTELGRKSDADLFKKLASGEPIEAKPLYKDPYTITRYAKLIFNTNELPRDVEQKNSYFRRFLIVPFEITIPENEQDKALAQRIIDNELSGILNWAMDGLKRLIKQGRFTHSDLSNKYLKEYQEESDSVRLFIKEMGIVESVDNHLTLKTLFNAYKEFCIQDGYKALSNTNFSKRLKELGFKNERAHYGLRYFIYSNRIEEK